MGEEIKDVHITKGLQREESFTIMVNGQRGR